MPHKTTEARVAYKKAWWVKNAPRISKKRCAKYPYAINPLELRLKLFEQRLARLTTYDIGYLAGLIDGEGSIMMNPVNSKYRTYVDPRVLISNSSPEIIAWCVCKLGDFASWRPGIPTTKYPDRAVKDMGRWIVSGKLAAALCTILLPHLTLKQRKAELVIELLDGESTSPGVKMSEHEWARRNIVYRKFKVLKRGW